MSNNIKTWADGYGRWHVEVPDSGDSLNQATRAIAACLWSRSDDTSPGSFADWVSYVKSGVREVPCEPPGQRHFIEYVID